MSASLGFILGPLIGSFLFNVGGYALTFGAIGCIIIFLSLITLAKLQIDCCQSGELQSEEEFEEESNRCRRLLPKTRSTQDEQPPEAVSSLTRIKPIFPSSFDLLPFTRAPGLLIVRLVYSVHTV